MTRKTERSHGAPGTGDKEEGEITRSTRDRRQGRRRDHTEHQGQATRKKERSHGAPGTGDKEEGEITRSTRDRRQGRRRDVRV